MMKEPSKGRCNVTLIFNDGQTVLKIYLADVPKSNGQDIISTGMRLATEFGGATTVKQARDKT